MLNRLLILPFLHQHTIQLFLVLFRASEQGVFGIYKRVETLPIYGPNCIIGASLAEPFIVDLREQLRWVVGTFTWRGERKERARELCVCGV